MFIIFNNRKKENCFGQLLSLFFKRTGGPISRRLLPQILDNFSANLEKEERRGRGKGIRLGRWKGRRGGSISEGRRRRRKVEEEEETKMSFGDREKEGPELRKIARRLKMGTRKPLFLRKNSKFAVAFFAFDLLFAFPATRFFSSDRVTANSLPSLPCMPSPPHTAPTSTFPNSCLISSPPPPPTLESFSNSAMEERRLCARIA